MVNIQNKMRFASYVCLLKTRYCYIVAAHMLYNTFFFAETGCDPVLKTNEFVLYCDRVALFLQIENL